MENINFVFTLLSLSVLSFCVITLFGMRADHIHKYTGIYPYKVDLFALAMLNGLIVLVLFAYILGTVS